MGLTLDTSIKGVVVSNSDIEIKAARVVKGGVTTEVWGSGASVVYIVDTGVSYSEDVSNGDSVLSPSFTPTKSGYTFVGWRKDKTASSSVLTSAVMDGNPITLYAVFSKDITVTYYNATSKAATTTGKQYYNNGNVADPKFTIEQLASPTWESRGWGTNSKGNADVVYDTISEREFSADTTVYALYQRTITLSYSGNGATSGSVASQSATRYWNSAGNYANPSFTLAANGFAKTDYNFAAWASGSADGTQYAAGASVTLTANTTFYAVWKAVAFYWWRAVDPGDGSGYYAEYASGYPSSWTVVDKDCDSCGLGWTEDNKKLYLNTLYCTGDDDANASINLRVSASTKGNTKAKIYISQMYNSTVTVNGTKITAAGTYSDIDVSSGTITIDLDIRGHGSYTHIDYVYFYTD